MEYHNYLVKSATLLSLLVFPLAAIAGFSTYSNNWPEQITVQDDEQEAKTPDNYQKPSEPCISVASLKPVSVNLDNRFYVKFGLNLITSGVKKIKNGSTGTLTNLLLSDKKVKDSYFSWEIGAGTKVNYLRYEIEYIYDKKISYNKSPLFLNNAINLVSEIQSTAITLNAYYDFEKNKFSYFIPYVGGCLGIARNKTSSATYDGTGDNRLNDRSYYGVAWGVMAGIRVPLHKRWIVYLGYKYAQHGQTKWRDKTDVDLRGIYTLNAVSMGVNFVF